MLPSSVIPLTWEVLTSGHHSPKGKDALRVQIEDREVKFDFPIFNL